MPIDPERVVGAALPATTASWDADDVILYHLGIGAGDPPTDPGELQYTYERGLKVLPSYAVLPAMGALLELLSMDGMDVSLATLLHGEQDLEIHADIPVSGEVTTQARVTGVHDKGKAALVELQAVSSAPDGTKLFTNRFGAFFRGEGGFGGGTESAIAPVNVPDREPDHVVTVPTLPQQALLYRLSGDKNPLHADPGFAEKAGFPRPILHGLCSYGLVLKAIVDHALRGDVQRVGRYRARFAGVLFPGETVAVSLWIDDDGVHAAARCVERDAPVLSHVAVGLR